MLERFVIDRDGAKNERVVLRGEIEKFQHGRAYGPLVADERLHDIGIGIARPRN